MGANLFATKVLDYFKTKVLVIVLSGLKNGNNLALPLIYNILPLLTKRVFYKNKMHSSRQGKNLTFSVGMT